MNRDPVLRAVLVEDEALFRHLLHSALHSSGHVEVVASYGLAHDALHDPALATVDVAILDIDLGTDDGNGIHLGMSLRERFPHIGVLLLSNHAHLAFARALTASGFTGWAYLLKKSVHDLSTVLRALDGVRRGEVVLDPQLVRSHSQLNAARFSHLTARQIELWELITQGYSNAAIAARLERTPKWIDNAVSQLYQVLDIDTQGGRINARVAAALLYAREAQNVHFTPVSGLRER